MHRKLFVRNTQARDNLEIFIVSAISSLLLLRFYLYLTGYPQVGGGNLHIAHMLWGGVLLVIAMVCNLAFLGTRMRRFTALIGGIGFGIFIDEIGKFLTKDNNYFFRPAVGIIYAVFALLYVVTTLLSRRQKLTSREYQLNALSQLEEAVLHDMDPTEKARVARLLAQADQHSPITHELQRFLKTVQPIQADKPNWLQRLLAATDKLYKRAWQRRNSNRIVGALFLLQIGLFALGVGVTLASNVDAVTDFFRGNASYGRSLVIGQLLSTVIAAAFAVIGVVRLRSSHVEAFDYFRRATLTNILLTEFFIFSRIQFGAMPSFLFNLGLLLLINLALAQERRLSKN